VEILTGFLNEVFSLWLDVSPYLFFGMAVAGLLHIFLGKEFISQQLGKGGIVSVTASATAWGIARRLRRIFLRGFSPAISERQGFDCVLSEIG